MKIKSITDIITNSSTEVFTIIHENDIDKIKQVINLVLKLGDSKYTWDDLFKIEFKWDEDCLKENAKCYESSIEELKDHCWNLLNYGEAPCTFPFIEVTSIKDISEKENELLQSLALMFAETTELYC